MIVFPSRFPDLVALATNQLQWSDLVGRAPEDPRHTEKVGLLLVTEAHLEYFFFHEYGRRVGMVPRSSLKEGKNSQMVEKGTKTTQQNQKTNHQPQPKGQVSTIL